MNDKTLVVFAITLISCLATYGAIEVHSLPTLKALYGLFGMFGSGLFGLVTGIIIGKGAKESK